MSNSFLSGRLIDELQSGWNEMVPVFGTPLERLVFGLVNRTFNRQIEEIRRQGRSGATSPYSLTNFHFSFTSVSAVCTVHDLKTNTSDVLAKYVLFFPNRRK